MGFVDNHYVLDGHCRTISGLGESRSVFGVEDAEAPIEKIEKRLHDRAREIAEEIARKYGVTTLEDFTKFQPAPLPRGGK